MSGDTSTTASAGFMRRIKWILIGLGGTLVLILLLICGVAIWPLMG